MARFDVYRRARGPGFLLDIQSDHLCLRSTRFCVPLLPPVPSLPAIRDLNPLLRVGEETLAMLTQFAAAVPRTELGRPVGNLLDQAGDITRALGILLSGF